MLQRLSALLVVGLCLVPAGLRAEVPGLKKPYFDSNGVKIHYTVQGKEDAEPVLLIHGFTATIETQWSAVLPALVKDYKVIAFDCRGHGGSAKPHDPKQYGLEMVRDAIRLLDHLKIKKAHVVGYSMGAGIALQLAVRYPERLRSVTLGGAGLPRLERERMLEALADSLDQGKGFGPLLVALTPKDRPRPSEAQIKIITGFILAQNDAKALAAAVRAPVGNKELRLSDQQVKAIKVPMVAIIGEIDPLREDVDELQKRLPGLKVIVLSKADHITAFIQPEFVSAVKEFLDAHRGTKD